MKKNRVVISGLGVVAPNALGINEFVRALKDGKSGIKHSTELKQLNFRCQIAGIPPLTQEYIEKYLPPFYQNKVINNGVIYGCLAGLEAWKDAGLEKSDTKPMKDAGIIFGSGALGLDSSAHFGIEKINAGYVRKLGSQTLPQYMNSGAVTYLNQILGLGNKIQANSSACITGTEAILSGYHEISVGKAKTMICGSTEGIGKFIWGAFDAMRVLCPDSNDHPENGSRPMNADSSGFVPSGGAGALVLESLESAIDRGATIYAEILGGAQNCGGMRNGGTMTSPNSDAVIECIQMAMKNAGIESSQIDLISAHLTSTGADSKEVENWKKALGLKEENFPFINTPKSMIGHCIAAAGSIESVASVLQIHESFVHKNINITHENIHPRIKELIPL